MIGAADMPQAQFGDMELSIDGWFDYAIWKWVEDWDSARLLVAERYAKNGADQKRDDVRK